MSSLRLVRLRPLPIFVSEQTAKERSGTSDSALHSMSVCDSRAMEGTRNRTLPPEPAMASAMRRDVKVLPVPHAMMSLPRSAVDSPAVTASRARFWCSRRLLPPVRTMTSGVSRLNESQSIVELNRSSRPIRETGMA